MSVLRQSDRRRVAPRTGVRSRNVLKSHNFQTGIGIAEWVLSRIARETGHMTSMPRIPLDGLGSVTTAADLRASLAPASAAAPGRTVRLPHNKRREAQGPAEPARVDPAVWAKVKEHPCYSEQAHHHFARMHVAVAPGCNIQCNYCNRKYDCANESRPGVVSDRLTPEQAVEKVRQVAARLPQLSVVGIAGPGDALHNAPRTLRTFELIRAELPDLTLCLSTNGLALPDHVDALKALDVHHVTITLNALDPEIGAEIYPWIAHDHRRWHGVEAARILLERQMEGLERAVAAGILVKVNSVMIPGVNDAHLAEVSRVVKAKGAFLHNVMPLIAEPEHGTFYGLMGQRGPTPEELRTLQDTCAGDMRMMRHCRQCRADAVGMLGEDRSADFTLEKIATMEIDHAAALQRRRSVRASIEARRQAAKSGTAEVHLSLASIKRLPPQRVPPARTVRMAVATCDGERIDEHFGQAEALWIYDVDAAGIRLVDQRPIARYCTGPSDCGETDGALTGAIRALEDCAAILCAKIGFEPWGRLEAAGIEPNGEHADEPIEAALTAVYREMAAAGRLPQAGAGAHQQAC